MPEPRLTTSSPPPPPCVCLSLLNQPQQARQPFPEMEGVYLVSPTHESVEAIKRDFRSPSEALYSKVHLFFLERVPPDLVQSIKQCPALVSRLKTFKVPALARARVWGVYVC